MKLLQKILRLATALSVVLIISSCTQQELKPYQNPKLSVDERVDDLLTHLTLEEKAGFMSGETMWYLQEIPRLGIPKLQVTDCGHGVTVILDENDDYSGCATSMPTAVGQAATWDRALIEKMGGALGRETRATGSGVLLAPMVNLHRIPVGGRNYETYSEDPYLTGTLAAAFIDGVQSQGTGTVIKAVTANNQQHEQHRFSAKMSERVLHELYLEQFRIAINQSDPWGIMTAYNGIALKGINDGKPLPTSESEYMIKDVIKGLWNYQGFVVSDWRAVVSQKSITAGVDIEMPGPGKHMDIAGWDEGTSDIQKAMKAGLIDSVGINEAARRYLRSIVKTGVLDIPRKELPSEHDTPLHHKIAREVAEGGIVLLKNKGGILPLDKDKIKNIGVFGPNAEEARLGGGGSASVSACRTVSPLKGLKSVFGEKSEITFIEGAGISGDLPVVGGHNLWTKDENGNLVNGLHAEYFDGANLQGEVQCSRIDDKIDYSWGWAAPCENVTKNNYSARWTGQIKAPETGVYKIGVSGNEAGIRLYIDGEKVVDAWGDPENEITEARFNSINENVELDMEEGSYHDIIVEFHKKMNRNTVRLEWAVPSKKSPIIDAVKLAEKCEVAIIFAGLSNLIEGGTNDKGEHGVGDMSLPGSQDKLITAVAKANPNTIVVLINGTPVEMPWINDVAAVVEAFYPGQEGGDAIANVLSGKVNPSGKLPDTFGKKLDDYLSMKYYPGDVEKGIVEYGEGLKVGYRQFDEDGIEPLFPFGFGLSYTTFELSNLKVEKKGDNVVVNIDVTNTGKVAGAEVAQIYVQDVEASVFRPKKELKGFEKVFLNPGETKIVSVELDMFAFSFYCEKEHDWKLEPGEFNILAGNSSRNIS
ncbi:MAG: glycoside hydrolase family 3 C-terminal domain-containing protein, partial [Bacteroidota bacterium]